MSSQNVSSSSNETQETQMIIQMVGHTDWVKGVVHLPGGRHIITGSRDGSLQLWDLESGTEIGGDWRDEGDEAEVWTIALSPNGNDVATGSLDGKVKLWDIEMGGVIAKWTGHTQGVTSVCWSADGERLVSGSIDGTARVWNVKSGITVLRIETGHGWVCAVVYSPNTTKIATGGFNDGATKIWDAKTGELLTTLERDGILLSLAWTSDEKKLISGSGSGSIRIFNTATWQEIAFLQGHKEPVYAISLSPNGRLLASTSWDNTVRLWNIDVNLPVEAPSQHEDNVDGAGADYNIDVVGPPLWHEGGVDCAAFSADGKLLVTGCHDTKVYVWDIHAILKKAGLEDLLSIPDANVAAETLLMEGDATQANDELPPLFFDDARDDVHFTMTHNPRSSARGGGALVPSFSSPSALISRLSSLIRRPHPNTIEATELQQRQRRTLLPRRGPRTIEVAAVRDKQALFVARRRQPGKQKSAQKPQHQAQASTSQAPVASTSTTPAPAASTTGTAIVQSPPTIIIAKRPWWARVVLFLCCASPRWAEHAQQQQVQSQDQTQASSSQTKPAAASVSTTPPVTDTNTTVPGAASAQSSPLPWRARFVLFLCCASPPHADGY